jgi:uncharacterized protein (DUF2235 family)
MRNIAIFCDGTWQRLSQPLPTNVSRLARAILDLTAAGVPQLTYYDDGVGVGEGVMDRATRLLGGAFGAGLDHKILKAYQFLALNYAPGDRIFVFGFSRGAYTARSLAGLLRRVWILRREHAGQAEAALDLYRHAPTPTAGEAEKAQACAAQRRFNRRFGHPAEALLAPGEIPTDPQGWAWVQHLGVWDTVGAMGVPQTLPFAHVLNRRHRWHDTDLSRFVRSARHAVAVDEVRASFGPALWSNLAALNTYARAETRPYESRPYQQRWFPGGHGSVGGGDLDVGLSSAALLWIAEGAARAGLALDQDQLAEIAAQCDPACESRGAAPGVLGLLGRTPRTGPETLAEAALPTRLRWRARRDWRPAALNRCAAALDAEPAPRRPPWFAP